MGTGCGGSWVCACGVSGAHASSPTHAAVWVAKAAVVSAKDAVAAARASCALQAAAALASALAVVLFTRLCSRAMDCWRVDTSEVSTLAEDALDFRDSFSRTRSAT